MTENEEKKILRNTVSWLLTLLTACPQVVKKGIGAESFAEELIKSGLEFDKYFPEIYGEINSFFPFIEICPQIFNPGIGIEKFLSEISKAAVIFNLYIKKPERTDN